MRFSILIPTGGRPHTILRTMETVLSQDGNDFEVIVSDNDDSGQTADLVSGVHDARVGYVKTPSRLSMTEHWNFALSQTRGDYVMILGDDDGLLSDAMSRVRATVDANEVDVVFADLDFFQWRVGDEPGEITRIAPNCRPGFVDLAKVAQTILFRGGARWESLPSIYRAFVSRRILDSIKQSSNVFCDSLNPDMYTGFALAGIEGIKAFKLSYPLAICAMSYAKAAKPMPKIAAGGEVGLLKRHVSEFDARLLVPLPAVFPRVFNSFAESMCLATSRFPGGYRGARLNINAHYGWMASWSGSASLLDFLSLKKQLREYGFKPLQFVVWFLAYRIWHVFSKLRSSLDKQQQRRDELRDVVEAARALTNLRQSKPEHALA